MITRCLDKLLKCCQLTGFVRVLLIAPPSPSDPACSTSWDASVMVIKNLAQVIDRHIAFNNEQSTLNI
ncbi:MAG: hypothetical protein WCL44_02095 [bacterium]